MKKLNYILITLIAIIALSSCDWLEPEESISNQIYQTAATLVYYPSGENIFITDDSLKLFPTNKITIPDDKKDSLLNQRYYISFQIEQQQNDACSINLISMQMMNKSDIIEIESNSDIEKYKNNILNLQALWCSGKYLNIITQIEGSGTKLHNYNLLQHNTTPNDTLYLTLRYDDNNDTEIYTLKQAIYYDLKPYLNPLNDSTTICFNYNSGYAPNNTIYLKIANK